MNHGMTPLGDAIMAVLAGAFQAAETGIYRPIYPPRFYQCHEQVWPSYSSKLGQLVKVLQDPRAMSWLQNHLAETLTAEISHTLRCMPYKEFLGTQYWWIVRSMLLVKRGLKCEHCQKFGILDVHHLTYEHRGAEVFHLDELKLLCRDCHDQQHAE